MAADDVATLPRLAFKIEDAPVVTGFSRTRIFEAIRNKQLTARKDGRATVILADELAAWLRSLPAVGKQPEEARIDAT